ncbi:YjjG family noncanonical pyrimidine nucleotidase [Christiangramia forsetii]|uniref:Haloacid dehalogenase-like hydrolase-possibly 5'-nucleotidase n=2 Tax=Christiangramia forsetii TaxID=411153 RepID=A0M5B7_CHRFK|nr:YjjG family noncanonical pyrimidine nucleotidase [Christiangramia forsetii]GGG21366.1 noncanonical pyrimidine nucleotidase, YjjG family protein [Christiangramia forsetii]CAL67812.1 haloacid dehalogenase-like hydrolase-possibly 5'-nucleotidase [Christiangramia forsetii KT0803]
MKLTNIKHVFFDLDHTLWDFDRNSALAFKEVFEKQKIELNVDDFLQVYMPINFKYWERYRNNSVTKEVLRYGRLKDSFDSLKFDAQDTTINIIADNYIEYLPNNNHLLEGSLEILDHLSRNYKLHIITNGFEEVQHKKMRNSAILDYFETITTSEDAGVKKPHPLIFEKALKKSGAQASNSVMIGDNLEADIIGAHEFGMHVIHLSPKTQSIYNQYPKIQKLKELLNYL